MTTLELLNAAVDRHWPRNPDGTCGEIYYLGAGGLERQPRWMLDGKTTVHADYVIEALRKRGEDVSRFVSHVPANPL